MIDVKKGNYLLRRKALCFPRKISVKKSAEVEKGEVKLDGLIIKLKVETNNKKSTHLINCTNIMTWRQIVINSASSFSGNNHLEAACKRVNTNTNYDISVNFRVSFIKIAVIEKYL